MSKSIFIKLFICSMFVVILSSTFCLPTSHALGDVISSGTDFLSKGNDIDKTLNTTELEKTSKYIYNTLLGIAVMVAIIVSMVLGIQFMAASADEKAKVKEAILPFVVGCIVVFGAFTIWKIAVNIGNNAETSIQTSSTQEAPTITWDKATSAKEYIDAGGDLTEVDDDTLEKWYGQLSRLSGNKGVMTDYYNKVRDECKRRGFWDEE